MDIIRSLIKANPEVKGLPRPVIETKRSDIYIWGEKGS